MSVGADMNERLGGLIEKSIRYADEHYPNSGAFEDGRYVGLMAECLIADGVIVLPCKVGDTVYVIIGRLLPTIAECNVIAVTHHVISLDNDRKVFSFSVVAKNSKTPDTFIDTDIGKRVFFNKEQAEKALAERRENK